MFVKLLYEIKELWLIHCNIESSIGIEKNILSIFLRNFVIIVKMLLKYRYHG